MARWKALPDELDPQVREFASQLRRLVDRSGLSTAALSDRTGYSKTSWERYLNGRLLFRGDDPARSRDYRFLGSIGYWDALYLPLREGDNEILLAVSEDHEDLGGWGVQAKLENLNELTLED